jgi:hypothetical protein
MHAHAATQHDFAVALFDPGASPPQCIRAPESRRSESGFAVYRNNVVTSLIGAIAARYPVVRRLAGEDSFRKAVHRFIVNTPPLSPVLLHYGEAFPRYLRYLGRSPCFEYLADIAELEMARGKAYHAADAVPVHQDVFAALDQGQLGGLRVRIHPSVSLVSSRFPIVTIWEANKSDGDDWFIRQWLPESALVARPFLDVEVWRLPHGGAAFIAALVEGATLAAAVDAGMTDSPDFEIATSLALLIEARIVVGFDRQA